eukprot:7982721-Pyramimonas_sp.AAC.1
MPGKPSNNPTKPGREIDRREKGAISSVDGMTAPTSVYVTAYGTDIPDERCKAGPEAELANHHALFIGRM